MTVTTEDKLAWGCNKGCAVITASFVGAASVVIGATTATAVAASPSG